LNHEDEKFADEFLALVDEQFQLFKKTSYGIEDTALKFHRENCENKGNQKKCEEHFMRVFHAVFSLRVAADQQESVIKSRKANLN
jgi:hypothetical protein